MITDLATKRIQALSQWQTFLGVPTNKMTAKINWYGGRKCAENYNKGHNKFIFKSAISSLVISNRNCFRVPFDKIDSVYFIWKI